ncbi:hypothetical protein [Dasania marina]|uniref:hypothetical protein n=1 Tax=Dasania marina TaxID=471499 RepID=UPI0030DAC85A|tara:strand:- start:337 stop:627 length:291 start_codon:yes stop_codon:yes gene_type:complete
MKTKVLTFTIALSTWAFTLSAQAHDPKEHMKDAKAPNCAAMKDMDHSKMDMKDPVIQAMMKQCVKDMHDNETESSDHEQSEYKGHTSGEKSTEHKH